MKFLSLNLFFFQSTLPLTLCLRINYKMYTNTHIQNERNVSIRFCYLEIIHSHVSKINEFCSIDTRIIMEHFAIGS